MPSEAIYDQLAKASDPAAIKKILKGAGAKIVYDSDAPDAPAAGDAGEDGMPDAAPPNLGTLSGDDDGEPDPLDSAEPAEGEAEGPDTSLKGFKKRALDKAFPPGKG